MNFESKSLRVEDGSPMFRDFIAEAFLFSEYLIEDGNLLGIIFGVTIQKVKEAFLEILHLDIEGNYLNFKNWRVLVLGDKPIAAFCSWLELPESRIESNKILLFSYVFNRVPVNIKLEPFNSIFSALKLDRSVGMVQIEYVYTDKFHRGKGYMSSFLSDFIANSDCGGFEIQLMNSNKRARELYTRLGFCLAGQAIEGDFSSLGLFETDFKLSLHLWKSKEII